MRVDLGANEKSFVQERICIYSNQEI